jgi:dTDP-4-dehydrorhamnose reductase
VYWTGLTTLELAKIIDRAIEINLTGLHHIVPDQKISKYDLLNLIAEIFQKDIVIKRDSEKKVDKSLAAEKIKGITVSDYRTQLIALKSKMIELSEVPFEK